MPNNTSNLITFTPVMRYRYDSVKSRANGCFEGMSHQQYDYQTGEKLTSMPNPALNITHPTTRGYLCSCSYSLPSHSVLTTRLSRTRTPCQNHIRQKFAKVIQTSSANPPPQQLTTTGTPNPPNPSPSPASSSCLPPSGSPASVQSSQSCP